MNNNKYKNNKWTVNNFSVEKKKVYFFCMQAQKFKPF